MGGAKSDLSDLLKSNEIFARKFDNGQYPWIVASLRQIIKS